MSNNITVVYESTVWYLAEHYFVFFPFSLNILLVVLFSISTIIIPIISCMCLLFHVAWCEYAKIVIYKLISHIYSSFHFVLD